MEWSAEEPSVTGQDGVVLLILCKLSRGRLGRSSGCVCNNSTCSSVRCKKSDDGSRVFQFCVSRQPASLRTLEYAKVLFEISEHGSNLTPFPVVVCLSLYIGSLARL